MTKQDRLFIEKIQYIETVLVEINKSIYKDENYSKCRSFYAGKNQVAYKVETEDLEEAIEMIEMNNMSYEIPTEQYHAPAWTFIYINLQA